MNGLVRDTLCILMKEPCIGTSDSQASSTMDVQEQRLQKVSCRNLVPVTVGFFCRHDAALVRCTTDPKLRRHNNYNCLLGASMTFSVATSEQYEKNRIAFLAASSRSRAVSGGRRRGQRERSAAQKQQQRQQGGPEQHSDCKSPVNTSSTLVPVSDTDRAAGTPFS